MQAKIAHGLIEEAGVAGLIAGHVGKAFRQQGIFRLDAAAQFLVEQEAREFRGAALLEEFNKDAAGVRVELVGGAFEFALAHEVVAVVILAEFFTDRFELHHVGLEVHRRHGVEVRGVEAGGQDCVLSRCFGRGGVGGAQAWARGGQGGGGGGHHRATRQQDLDPS